MPALDSDTKVYTVVASFNRIKYKDGLAREFYRNLFILNPKVKEYFFNTDFEHQEKALLHGLQFMLQFLDTHNSNATGQLKRLAYTHSSHGLKIHPHHYYYWTEALIKTVKEFDPYWHDKLENLWREVIHYPVSFMISQYAVKDT